MNKRNRTVLGVVLVAASASGFFACGGRLDDEAVTTATDDAGEEPSADATTSDASSFRDAAIADDAGSSNLAEAAVDAGPPPPRLIAPLSTALVTTRRPTLHWSLPAAETDVMLDLCRDRACADPIAASVPVTGSTYTPASDLPSGVVFWRARSTVTSVSSATWEFRVGASSTPIDTSGGTFLDLNGDGLADIATT
ncbi:MAG TPA: hypothetical protein VF407_19945, partial [Polyangiaceae bacterium]